MVRSSGCGDGDEHFWLAGVDQALAKGLEDGIVTAGGEACEKEGGAHGLATAGDHGFALPLAGLAGERGKPARLAIRLPSRVPSSGSSAMSVRAVIGPTPERRRGGPLLAPCWRSAHGSVDFRVNLGEFLLQRGDQAGDALADPTDRDALLPIALGDDHLNDLAAPRDELGEQLGRFVGEGTQVGLVASTKRAIISHRSDRSWRAARAPGRSGALARD